MMGELLFLQKNFKEAIRQFFKVAYGYGYPNAPDGVKKWQANSTFEAARCFENTKEIEKAKKAYQEVVDQYPQSSQAAPAKARLQALGS